jgi:hypothetical protein
MTDSDFPAQQSRLVVGLPDPRNRNQSGADRLFQAIVCLLAENGTDIVADALKPEDVAARASKSRASYYRTEGFPAVATHSTETRREVLISTVRRALEESARAASASAADIVRVLSAGSGAEPAPRLIEQATAFNFETVTEAPFVVQLLSAALAYSSPSVEAALAEYYETATNEYAGAVSSLLAGWGYRVLPPLDERDLVVVAMALGDGLAMRRSGDPAVDRDFFARNIGAVVAMLVAPAAEDQAPVQRVVSRSASGDPPTRAAIIESLGQLCQSSRMALPTIVELADAAGCTDQTIRSLFGGVDGVVRAAWHEWLPEFEESAERVRRSNRAADTATILYRVLVRIAVRATGQPAMARALLMSEIGQENPGTGESRREPVAALIDRILEEATSSGTLSVPAAQNMAATTDRNHLFARTLRNHLLQIVIGAPRPPGRTVEEHARSCVDYVWSVMLPATPHPAE